MPRAAMPADRDDEWLVWGRERVSDHRDLLKNWDVHIVSDGLLITGQNPASSGPAVKVLPHKLNDLKN